MADQFSALVRIKPYNKRRGQLCRNYMVHGKRFLEARGWYEISDRELAKYLKEIRQDQDDPDSPFVFDVTTQSEAVKIDKREEKAAETRAQAGSPNADRLDKRKKAPANSPHSDKKTPKLSSPESKKAAEPAKGGSDDGDDGDDGGVGDEPTKSEGDGSDDPLSLE